MSALYFVAIYNVALLNLYDVRGKIKVSTKEEKK